MRQWPVLSDEHSCPVLAAAVKSYSLPVYVCVCIYVCEFVCVRHPCSAPVKRKASPQRSLRQLHPTTWPQTTRLPITLCHISDFCFHVCVLVEFLICALCCAVFTGRHPGSLQLNFPFSLPQFEPSHLGETGWTLLWTAFPHWACVAVARWRYSPDAQWLRCEGSINEQQIRTGGGKTTAISLLSSPASTLSGQENRSGERRAIGGVGLF